MAIVYALVDTPVRHVRELYLLLMRVPRDCFGGGDYHGKMFAFRREGSLL